VDSISKSQRTFPAVKGFSLDDFPHKNASHALQEQPTLLSTTPSTTAAPAQHPGFLK